MFHRTVSVVDGFAHRDAEWYVEEKSSRLFLWFHNDIEPRPHYEYHWREGDMGGDVMGREREKEMGGRGESEETTKYT